MTIVAGELLLIVCAGGMIICDLRILRAHEDMRARMLTLASMVVRDNLGAGDGRRALGTSRRFLRKEGSALVLVNNCFVDIDGGLG